MTFTALEKSRLQPFDRPGESPGHCLPAPSGFDLDDLDAGPLDGLLDASPSRLGCDRGGCVGVISVVIRACGGVAIRQFSSAVTCHDPENVQVAVSHSCPR